MPLPDDAAAEPAALGRTAARGAIGGALMGLANLVPGISGGTMLLATGVYRPFIHAIAEITTLRFRAPSMALLAAILGAASLAILLLAGSVRDLVVEQRWLMYSLFIGLTLGGVPVLWRLARPASPALVAGALAGLAGMIAMALGAPEGSGDASGRLWMFAAGVAAASAMILPGVSGGYLLLLLGQYEAILGAVDRLRAGLLGEGAPDWSQLGAAFDALFPLGLGIVAGVVGVSNLLRWLLDRYEKATLGVLLGLLLGAVVGLWPFQQPREPEIGETLKGSVVHEANRADFAPEDWPLESFTPSSAQGLGALAAIAAGFVGTWAIGRLGREAGSSASETG